MAFDDLRSFLQALDEQGQLLKIEEEVNAEPDLAAAANATGRIGDGAPEHHRLLAKSRYFDGAACEHAGEKADRRVYSPLG